MLNANKTKSSKRTAHQSDLRDARPLLQAIFLGIVLAAALVAAAALANPDSQATNTNVETPATETTISPHIPAD